MRDAFSWTELVVGCMSEVLSGAEMMYKNEYRLTMLSSHIAKNTFLQSTIAGDLNTDRFARPETERTSSYITTKHGASVSACSQRDSDNGHRHWLEANADDQTWLQRLWQA